MDERHSEEVETLIARGEEVITDEFPGSEFESVLHFYERRSYQLWRWEVLGGGDRIEATFAFVAKMG